MGDRNLILHTSAAVPLPLKYANGIFTVGPHTSERNSISDFLPPLLRTPASVAVGSSHILLPRVFPLAGHGDVPAKVSLLIAESNRFTTEA